MFPLFSSLSVSFRLCAALLLCILLDSMPLSDSTLCCSPSTQAWHGGRTAAFSQAAASCWFCATPAVVLQLTRYLFRWIGGCVLSRGTSGLSVDRGPYQEWHPCLAVDRAKRERITDNPWLVFGTIILCVFLLGWLYLYLFMLVLTYLIRLTSREPSSFHSCACGSTTGMIQFPSCPSLM